MYPVTNWIVEVRPDHMEADAAYFDQAQQGLMLGQPFMPTPQLPVSQLPTSGQKQTLPVGQTTEWEIEERVPYMHAPAIVYGGMKLGQVPIIVEPNDELEKRVGIMQAHPFDNPGLWPVKMSGAFLGQFAVRVNSAAPASGGWGALIARAAAQKKAADEAADRAATAHAAAQTRGQIEAAENALEAAAEAQCEATHAHVAVRKKDVAAADAAHQASLLAVRKSSAFVDQATLPSVAGPSSAPASSSSTTPTGSLTPALAVGGGLLIIGGAVLYSILK
jgi:hypothetical protein